MEYSIAISVPTLIGGNPTINQVIKEMSQCKIHLKRIF